MLYNIWYDELHDDKIEPFTLDYDSFSFNDSNYVFELLLYQSKSKNLKIRRKA